MRPEVLHAVRSHLSPSMEVREVLYDRDSSYALQCFRPADQSSFVVKAKYPILLQDNELQIMQNLTHDSILGLISYEEIAFEGDKIQLLYMEYSEMTLRKEIENRASHQFPWTEVELTNLLASLTAAFKYLQDNNIAHMDITPDHVFVTREKKAKVGDLEKAREVSPNSQAPASPTARRAMGGNNKYVIHSAFQSDVYSLGVLFWQMATLNLQSPFTTSALDSLSVSSEFKRRLRSMLVSSETEPLDFVQLHASWQPWRDITFRPVIARVAQQETPMSIDSFEVGAEKVPLSEREDAKRRRPQRLRPRSVFQRCYEICSFQ